MKEIAAVVSAVRRRLYASLAIEHFFRGAFTVTLVLAAIVLFAKIVFLPGAMEAVGYAAVGGAALVCAYALFTARTRGLAAAIAADEKLGLAERLSSALLVAGDESPVAQAVVADAIDHARSIRVGAQFPVGLPRRWWHLGVSVIVLIGILCLPQLDPFGRQAALKHRERDRAEAAKEVEKLRKKVADLKKIVAGKDTETLELLNDIDLKLDEVEAEHLGKKETLAALSGPIEKLAERMKEIAKEFAKGAQSPEMQLSKEQQDKLLAGAKSLLNKFEKALQTANLTPEQMAELAKALEQAAKNQEALSEAKSQMDKLAEALQQGGMTPEQMAQLAKALEQLAQAMAKQADSLDNPQLAQQNAELAKQLSQLAQAARSGNQQALQQQLQKAQGLLNTSLRGLNTQMAALMQKSAPLGLGQQVFGETGDQQQMAEGSQDLMEMAGAMQGLDDFKNALTGVGSMSIAEALEQLRAAALLAQGKGSGRGSGMQGPGIGEGNTWPVGEDTGDLPQKDKVSTQMQKGKVIASYLVPGGNIKNEMRAELENVIVESKQAAKEALGDQKVPRAYEKVVKSYFDNLEVPK